MLTCQGTGITLYTAQLGIRPGPLAVNVQLTLDGDTSSAQTKTSTYTGSANSSNIVLYDMQSLPYGNHNVTAVLLGNGTGQSVLWFDYAVVNETTPGPSSSATLNPPATSTSAISVSSTTSAPSASATSTSAISVSSTTSALSASATSTSAISVSSTTSAPSAPSASGSLHSQSVSPYWSQMRNPHDIVCSTDLGAIIAGVVGGLVVLVMTATALLCARRKKHKRETAGLDSGPRAVILDSRSMAEGNSGMHTPLPNNHTPLTKIVPNPANRLSDTRPVPNPVLMRDLTSTSLDITTTVANTSFHSTASPSQNNELADNQPPIILALPPPSLPVEYSTGTAPVQPARDYVSPVGNMHGLQTVDLTDEQIDSVAGLLSTNVPPTDIARIVVRMREQGGASREGLRSGEMSGGIDTDAAPPAYDVIDN
jgi:hypothetical protein